MNYLDNLFNLKGKTAVITGGGGVLAGSIGMGLSKAGVNIVMADIRVENAENTAEKINKEGGNAIGVSCNVLSRESLEETNKLVLEKFQTIDILVNAAGGNVPGATINPEDSVFDVNIDDLDKVTNLNYKGTLLPSLVFGKTMAKQKSGNIINISSMAAMRSITRVLGYSVAKAAVSNFTQWMAMEMSRKYGHKIRVNAIAPGFFIGDQNRALLTNTDGSYTERGNLVVQNTPMGRFGDASELIGAVLYLTSDASTFVTGVILPVDGGFSFFSGV
ncbi:MAG: SDR family oxidoreductase [Bacteroidales bacterium]|nr:SDR family oxidoreductase [Bacteroidales bacterium]MBN2817527.1 SDR family oxidoreductase [Bacteroidales bacterium]